jgi:hypothetical protein
VVQSERELGPWGALPAITDDTLSAAFGAVPVPERFAGLGGDQ